jgi:hypothetical protein
MSDKDVEKFVCENADFGPLSESDVSAIARLIVKHAVECTAPAPLYRRDEDGTISVVNEAATPQVTPTERSDKDCLITSPTVCPQCGSGQQKYRWCIQLRPHQISNESCRLCDNQWHEQTEEPQSSA